MDLTTGSYADTALSHRLHRLYRLSGTIHENCLPSASAVCGASFVRLPARKVEKAVKAVSPSPRPCVSGMGRLQIERL